MYCQCCGEVVVARAINGNDERQEMWHLRTPGVIVSRVPHEMKGDGQVLLDESTSTADATTGSSVIFFHANFGPCLLHKGSQDTNTDHDDMSY